MDEYKFEIRKNNLFLKGDSEQSMPIEIMCRPVEGAGGYTLAWIKPHKEGGVDVHSVGVRPFKWSESFNYEDFVKLVMTANDLFKDCE